MRSHKIIGAVTASLLSATVLSAPALATDIYLVAAPFVQELPKAGGGTISVPMWGYAAVATQAELDAIVAGGPVPTPTAPGPLLVIDPDEALTVHLLNKLRISTSLEIPGQVLSGVSAASAPGVGSRLKTWIGANGTSIINNADRPEPGARVYSMTRETPRNQQRDYHWTSVKPGSFIYQSATHPAAQVQMGLYGAIRIDAAAGVPYQGQPAVDAEIDIVLSEIDVDAHQAIAATVAALPNSNVHPRFDNLIDYEPDYFLVNGAPFDPDPLLGSAAHPVTLNARTLLRFYNTGFLNHVQALSGGYLDIIAEDGNPYPYARQQYAVQLVAGKTRDAIYTPTATGTVALFDPMRDGPTPGGELGGMVSKLETDGNGLVAVSDSYNLDEDTPLFSVAALDGVLANDTAPSGATASLVTAPASGAGVLTFSADGSFTFVPAPNYAGPASFTYAVNDGTTLSAPGTVILNITPINDPPVAVAETLSAVAGKAFKLAAPGLLANDTDIEHDPLTAVLDAAPKGVTLKPDGSLQITKGRIGKAPVTITYHVCDVTLCSAPVTTTVVVNQSAALP